ncbi:MAG: GDP-mannose 4,6-dehydratase [Ginsengibacter sp.]
MNNPTSIIFGGGGQDGFYLRLLLQQAGNEVISIERNNSELEDISNLEFVEKIIKKFNPEYIFHLAANSSTRDEVWQQNHETISTGTLNILEGVKLYSPLTKVFLSGSGLQFENKGRPIKETDPFAATSMYAVSRIQTVYAARYYRSLGLKVYIGYFFNHDSPHRTERHINKKIIETVKNIAQGRCKELFIGDLSIKKEFGFAGDIVKGILTLIEQEKVFESVIGTGVAHSIEEWVAICFALYSLNWQNFVKPLQNFIPEYKILVSDPSTIFSLGWKPETDIYLLAKMMNI